MNLFMFPGQGSQFVGMGKEYFDSSAKARDVFLEVDDALSFKLSDLIFAGNDSDLTSTENAQVAIMTTSIAHLKVLEEQGINVSGMVAGHSLGEYTALCAAGVISLRDTAKLLWARGNAMKECAPDGYGMLAVIGLNIQQIEELLTNLSTDDFAEVANDNSEIQVVVSGLSATLDKVADLAKQAGAKRAIKLNVSGPFHSSKMAPAGEILAKVINDVKFNEPICPVICNFTGKQEINCFQDLLVKQISNRVRWRESILNAKEYGVTKAIEVGPGKVLTGLVKRICPEIEMI